MIRMRILCIQIRIPNIAHIFSRISSPKRKISCDLFWLFISGSGKGFFKVSKISWQCPFNMWEPIVKTLANGIPYIIEEGFKQKEGNGRRCCLGDRIPCRASYFAPGRLEKYVVWISSYLPIVLVHKWWRITPSILDSNSPSGTKVSSLTRVKIRLNLILTFFNRQIYTTAL